MRARNQVGIGLSYRPSSLFSLAIQFQIRFLESIPRPIAGLSFRLRSLRLAESIPWNLFLGSLKVKKYRLWSPSRFSVGHSRTDSSLSYCIAMRKTELLPTVQVRFPVRIHHNKNTHKNPKMFGRSGKHFFSSSLFQNSAG